MDKSEFDFFIHRMVRSYNDWSTRKIVICPFGALGIRTKQILNMAYGLTEDMIIDNNLANYNPHIARIEDLKATDLSKTVVLLTTANPDINKELEKDIKSVGKVEIRNLLKPIPYELREGDYFTNLRMNMQVMGVKDKNFVRVGREHDGGYLMINEFGGGHAYSFGIADDVSWDEQMTRAGYDVYMYDMTIDKLPKDNAHFYFHKIGIAGRDRQNERLLSMETILRNNGDLDNKNLILKMDVEGAEWDFIKNTDTLRNFEQIVIEFHNVIKEEARAEKIEALKKINTTHQIVWMHGNNYGSFGRINNMIVPDVIEATYVRRDKYDFTIADTESIRRLNAPNDERILDIELGDWDL